MISFWKLVHVLTAFWLVAGLVGRGVALGRARKSSDVKIIKELLEVAGKFEKLMVIPASMAILIFGLVTAYAEGLTVSGGANRWLVVSFILYIALMLLVPTVFIPRGKKFDAAFQQALASGSVTPELTARFNDPVVAAAHRVELGVVLIVIVLMVTKPF